MSFDVNAHLITVQGGKLYLKVADRLVWFREEKPLWSIETEPVEVDIAAGYAVFKAHIKDETGRIIGEGTKMENKQGFPDYLEKAETGSIGRALLTCGYGTAFAPELDEGERLADAPVDRGGQGEHYTGEGNQEERKTAPRSKKPATKGDFKCSKCGDDISVAVNNYSMKAFSKALCMKCQKSESGGD